MSRDWTAQILHKADLEYRLSKSPLVLTVTNTGEKIMRYDPDCEYAVRWPNAYFLAETVFNAMKESPEKLDKFETALAEVIRRDDAGEALHITDNSFHNTVADWYLGYLDPGFYYSIENNEMMIQYINDYFEKG